MAHRVLLYTLDGATDVAEAYLASHGQADEFVLVGLAHRPMTSPTAAELAGFEAVLGEFMPVRAEEADVMSSAGVRLVASMSIGLNHVDVAALAERGILTTNCPGYCADEVAEHAVALMLDLMRQVTASNRDVLAGGWDPHFGYEMRRATSQTCGLVFFGSIARHVVPIVQALGMHVVVWAPTKTGSELAAEGCEKVETLDELLGRSDIVSLHCPLIPMTKGLIGAPELARMKPTAFLVNTSRGGVVDEEALADALEAGTIRAAGLDVLADEAHPNKRLIDNPHCIVTPHLAYESREAAEALVTMSMKSVCELLVDGCTPAWVAWKR